MPVFFFAEGELIERIGCSFVGWRVEVDVLILWAGSVFHVVPYNQQFPPAVKTMHCTQKANTKKVLIVSMERIITAPL